MSISLKDFQRREYLMSAIKIPKASHDVRTRVFTHRFTGRADERDVLGTSGVYKEVYYTFLRDPNERELGVILHDELPGGINNLVKMWLMYAVDDKIHVGIAAVQNVLELGAKHGTIAQAVVNKYGKKAKFTFIAAGEMRSIDSSAWEFNYFSGTFMAPRVESLEEMPMDEEGEQIDPKGTISDFTFVTKQLEKLFPFSKFHFSTREFRGPTMAFSSFKNSLNPEEYPYVLPVTTPAVDSLMKYASSVMSDFTVIEELNPTYQLVNSYAVKPESIKTSMTLDEIEKYDGPEFKSKVAYLGTGKRSVQIKPHKLDFKRAAKLFSDLGVFQYKNMKADKFRKRNVEGNDFLGLEGTEFDLVFNKKVHRVTVDKFLGMSNNAVYKVTWGDAIHIMKLDLLYPFGKKLSGAFFGADDAKLYGLKVVPLFIAYGTTARAILVPFLGEPIKSIPMEDRAALYPKFKQQYVKQYVKMVSKGWGGRLTSIYNDPKPANTTVDENGDFHLIDPDRFSYTPSYYGPTSTENSIRGQIFGILMVFYYFLTGDEPFLKDSSDAAKSKWVKSLEEGSKIKEIFDKVMDTDKTPEELVKILEEFVSI